MSKAMNNSIMKSAAVECKSKQSISFFFVLFFFVAVVVVFGFVWKEDAELLCS